MCGIALVPTRALLCGSNEVVSTCATPCPATCSEPNNTCQFFVCNIGCVCKSGFIRESTNGSCIPEKDCPKCEPNQVWEKCSDNACKRTCENQNITMACPNICISGCSCAPGYVWNANLTDCISEDSCPKDCACNQEWEQCSDNLCKKTCANKDLNEPCPQACIPGCSCKPGYVWNENLTECILACECPIECGPNQVWEECSDNVCRKTCLNRNGPEHCPLCPPGCSCKDGFVWNEDYSECIPIDECPPQCGTNQVWENCSDNACKRTCENRNKVVPCPLICEPGCSCKDGFVWNENLTECVPIDSCPIECGDNQIYEECSDNLCKKTCANKDLNEPCPQACVPGCSCKSGYVWNENLTDCVLACECPLECGPNQVWEKCSDNACRKTCRNRNGPEHCPICPPGCSCIDGFVWNDDYSACIPIDECPPQCGTNQVWENCSDNECKRTCENRNKIVQCPLVCKPGCSCEDGFVWDKNLTECIPIDSCPIGCGTNQVYEECSDNNCKKTCATKNVTLPCPTVCTPGCSCEKNYVWNDNLTECVPVDMCPEACDQHQVWEMCSDNACKKTCENRNVSIPCPKICVPGCSCVSGYVWNSEQTGCISEDSCPKHCGDNQEWEQCSDNLCKRTCANKDQNLTCPQVCVEGCSCKAGYVWNENLTECIPDCECPEECGLNQIWEKCSDNNCRKTCQNRNGPSDCPPCSPGCSCKEGFVWNQDFSVCIAIDKCPPQCGTNQVWENCSDNACKRTCDNKDKIVPCPLICRPGCSCKDGYVWNRNLTECIAIDTCPTGCGTNQIYEECSDNNCKRTCSTKNATLPCSTICIPGCSCEKNYVWNDNFTECVPVDSCPEDCGPHQIWEKCSDNVCKRTCENRNLSIPCPKICVPGCSCVPDFVWNAEQTSCISEDSCPKQCGDNQEWEKCSDNLCKKTCSNKDVNTPCPQACIEGCSCKKGYVWTENLTECIPDCDCPIKCEPNQVFEQCSDNACKRTCENKDHQIICPAVCLEGCSCKQGYVWNEDLTTCIPIDSCPKECDVNQKWEQCSDNACKRTCENRDTPIVCPSVCIPGCSCINGTVWNKELTKCISVEDCHQKCGPHQIWETCSDALCRKTCEHLNGPQPCPRACIPGCSCEEGYVWNKDITHCIPKEKCCGVCGPHQSWKECSDVNCKRNCKNLNDNLVCTQACIPGCSCNPGYVWNEDETECILACDCHDCGDRGEWSDCAQYGSRPTCQHKEKRPCSNCVPGCVCKKEYIWDENLKRCVFPYECTPVCRKNEVFEVCSNVNCRTTCNNINFTSTPKCDKKCTPGCSCAPGFVWDEKTKHCVCPNDCPPVCEENEEWSPCTSLCDETCQGPRAYICPTVCIPGCKCKNGYLFDKYRGKCVHISSCTKRCDDKKQWCRYAPQRPVTCQNALHPQCYKSNVFKVNTFPGCICETGTILDEYSNKCVSLHNCLHLLNKK
ncbi:hypothetical protein FQR65_LT16963 [Abscondita terminalis]|nr:hypothetical protein FQR65_LT16963 [Abscondita terminalis]